jgi:hypothetical protein
MVEVGRFDTRAEAEVARLLLAAAGIPCVLAPGDETNTQPIDVSGAPGVHKVGRRHSPATAKRLTIEDR